MRKQILKEYCHSQVLQQKVMDLYEAFKKFFKGQGRYPKFKEKINASLVH